MLEIFFRNMQLEDLEVRTDPERTFRGVSDLKFENILKKHTFAYLYSLVCLKRGGATGNGWVLKIGTLKYNRNCYNYDE